jgi:hypothetical protein
MRRFAVLAALCFAVLPTLAWSQGKMPNAGQMPPGAGTMPMGQGMMGPGMMGPGMMNYDNMGPGMMDGGPAMMMRMMGMMGMSGMMGMIDGASHIDGRIAFLKAELKLDAAQAKLFEPVEKVLRDAATRHAAQPMPMPMAGAMKEGLPARLDAMEKILAEHIEALRALKAAVAPLYEALKPEQREIADRFLLRSMM